MTTCRLNNPSDIFSPALLVDPSVVQANLLRAIHAAGDPSRLRPHVKTHKSSAIARLALGMGITKHKCATLAEAEMLAAVGAKEILIAYPMVGPNARRLARLIGRFPEVRFAVTMDNAEAIRLLANELIAHRQSVEVLVDIDVGQHRTGVPLSEVGQLYELIGQLPGVRPGGFQVYDGQNRQIDPLERAAAIEVFLEPVRALRRDLEKRGLPVPRMVLGGTPTFPIHSKLKDSGIECSPGTFVLHDAGYGERYPDLPGFEPAAVLMTRVVSRPTPSRVTLDLGTKAVASDPPAGQRVKLLNAPPYEAVAHNEEHLIIETAEADRFHIGDVIYALPTHVCPTVALYPKMLTVEHGEVTGIWPVSARDR